VKCIFSYCQPYRALDEMLAAWSNGINLESDMVAAWQLIDYTPDMSAEFSKA